MIARIPAAPSNLFSFLPENIAFAIDWTFKYYPLVRQGGYILTGAKNAGYESYRGRFRELNAHSRLHVVTEKVKNTFLTVIAGATMLISGGFGISAEIGNILEPATNDLIRVTSYVAHTFFIISNTISLKFNVDRYFRAKLSFEFEEGEKRINASREMKIAVIGILSSLAYIFSTCLLLFGVPIALVMVFGGIATSTSCIQALLDYYHQYLIEPKNNSDKSNLYYFPLYYYNSRKKYRFSFVCSDSIYPIYRRSLCN